MNVHIRRATSPITRVVLTDDAEKRSVAVEHDPEHGGLHMALTDFHGSVTYLTVLPGDSIAWADAIYELVQGHPPVRSVPKT